MSHPHSTPRLHPRTPTARERRYAAMALSHRRLKRLYEISKTLARFVSIERTVPETLSVVSKVIPLHSVILLLGRGSHRAYAWLPRGANDEQLEAALARMKPISRELMGANVTMESIERSTFDGCRPLPENDGASQFTALPLVVHGGTTIGVLQIEGTAPLDEHQLAFFKVYSNQLAIAVDRQAIVEAREAAILAEEKRQHFLADVSAKLAATLNPEDAAAALARLVVPALADICVVDEVDDGGHVRRLITAFGDPETERALVDELRSPDSGAWCDLDAKVVESSDTLLADHVTDPLTDGLIHDPRHAELLRAGGVTSMVALPLCAHGKPIGVVTLAASHSARHYSQDDLPLLEELGRRAGMAMDNARLYQQALEATRDREELLAIVSHDLRTPLNLVCLNLELMQRDPNGHSLDRIDNARRACDTMNRLIEDLLDASSINARSLSMARISVRPEPIVSEVLSTVEPQASEKSLTLTSDVPEALPLIDADPARLRQVFFNLLGNALKFTPNGGSVTVSAEPAGNAVIFSVADTGPGIGEDEIPHLFDRFWTAAGRPCTGSGLGLFVVKGIVDAHGGSVWVESTPGEGSIFFFSIPTASAAAATGNASPPR